MLCNVCMSNIFYYCVSNHFKVTTLEEIQSSFGVTRGNCVTHGYVYILNFSFEFLNDSFVVFIDFNVSSALEKRRVKTASGNSHAF